MESNVQNDVNGIAADYSGNCVCTTCHVYIVGRHVGIVGAPEGDEDDEKQKLDMRWFSQ